MKTASIGIVLFLLSSLAYGQAPPQVLDSGRVGPAYTQDGSAQPLRLTRDASLGNQETHARYQEAVLRGNVYFISVAAAAPTAFTGGAAGTPLLACYNPPNSGRDLVLWWATIGIAVSGGTAGIGPVRIYAGPSALPTATATASTNMLSLAATGSAVKCFSNTATTGSTALSFLETIGTYYWATAASAFLAPVNFEAAGSIVIIPGNAVAIGFATFPASTTADATLVWEEVQP
jgi:hypothetical protein